VYYYQIYPYLRTLNHFCPGGVRLQTKSSVSFDPMLSLFLLTLCNQATLAFKQPTSLIKPTFPEHFKSTSFFKGAVKNSEAFGFILESDDKVILVFRGTVTQEDIAKDFNISLVPFNLVSNGGTVHEGFLSIYIDINKGQLFSARDFIFKTLQTIDPKKSLYITGYSLGGAVATLSALDIAVNTKFKNPVVYSFGSPRVGNDIFVSTFNKTISNSFRIINDYDIVPSLPPGLLGYHHVKEKVRISVNKNHLSANHHINTAYFPGITKMIPQYSKELCDYNPPGFCPQVTISYFQNYCLQSIRC
jgi:triacylglycerol lipase